MKTVIIIPARFASTRYPGKPLVALRQADGTEKSLIRMTWEAALQVRGVAEVWVATDDGRIRDHAESFGARVVMTSPDCQNGTERCAEALVAGEIAADLVVNLQGDAPLTPPWFVEALIAAMAQDGAAEMATPVLEVDAQAHAMLLEDRRAGRVGATTAVFAGDGRALYFSKEVLPFVAPEVRGTAGLPIWHHVGVYAYRPAALAAYRRWPVGRLEALEGLEQLRFLENGARVACVPVAARGRSFWELNNPEDVARIEAVLAAGGAG